jgi:flavin reductase (DIM6/NTAB) family NADH-FMN oxidoreductase RutF
LRRPWNILNLPVYSLATYADDKVNMNICTYVTAISMKPKQFAIAVYYGTKTYENTRHSSYAILQILNTSTIGLVRKLGKKSGLTIDKHYFLSSKDLLTNWNGYQVLRICKMA